MTLTIRASVRRLDHQWWVASAWANDATKYAPGTVRQADAPTWPEAMQLAQVLRAELDRDLMDEVHAERVARHAEVKP